MGDGADGRIGVTINLDHGATTPVDAAVIERMAEALRDGPGNPSSDHVPGRRAAAALERARGEVADLVGASPEAIVFTSGATEANNLAIIGAARHERAAGRGDRIITSAVEHRAVLEPCARLEAEGFRVTRLAPEPDGRIAPERLEAALGDDVALVSLMHVNNETGAVNDIAVLGAAVRAAGARFHVDAAQSAAWYPLDVDALGVDLLSLSAHKLYGPPGAGALFVRRRPRVRLQALILGGGQEGGLRGGTVAVHQAVGFGHACALAAARRNADALRVARLRLRLLDGLAAAGGLVLNGPQTHGAPHLLNVSPLGVHGEALRMDLDRLAVSSGSACSSHDRGVSHVLRALGRPDALAGAALRFGLGRETTERDVDAAVEEVTQVLRRLRLISPVWRKLEAGASAEAVYASRVPLPRVS